MDIIKKLTEEFSVTTEQAQNVVNMLDEGNTIPFIARYRKELTGSMSDTTIRELSERLTYLRSLEERKETVVNSITEQGKMTDELALAIANAQTVTELEDIYRPYKPKRRTRATIAVEKGLTPLANIITLQQITEPLENFAKDFVSEEKEIPNTAAAIAGAMDIIAEEISDNADYRAKIRDLTFKKGIIKSALSKEENANSVYEMYYEYEEPVSKIPGHRILAINRGENEKVLTVKIDAPVDDIIKYLEKRIIKGNKNTDEYLKMTIDDSYKRLIAPSIEREIRTALTESAQESAIKVFGENLKQLLMQPPIKNKRVLALDPGYRNGCKLAAVDGTGKVLETGVIYPTIPPKVRSSAETLERMILKNKIELLAIGNGTASRETEAFAVDVLKKIDKDIKYVIVNEAGASVYSASKLGAEEFPDFDVAVRSSVSLARRLQDPLAELVKIEPQAIGVGQYQHDMNKKRLSEALGGVVEDCVNNVGVDLNTASPSLLSYVSGISGTIAKNILEYREANGTFKSRKELLKVPKLGPKAFEQCAGFLRVDGDEPLDNTGVHPESYKAAKELISLIDKDEKELKNGELKNLDSMITDKKKTADQLGIGLPTLIDLIKELEKPGRDPREELPAPILKSDVLELKDLKEGMVLKGTVRNVIDFGVFVDIGVHQDGLVHISQLCNKFVKHPLEVVSVGDIVDVKVLGVDEKKGRISLSMRDV